LVSREEELIIYRKDCRQENGTLFFWFQEKYSVTVISRGFICGTFASVVVKPYGTVHPGLFLTSDGCLGRDTDLDIMAPKPRSLLTYHLLGFVLLLKLKFVRRVTFRYMSSSLVVLTISPLPSKATGHCKGNMADSGSSTLTKTDERRITRRGPSC
jgi:hypothetical protein